MLPSLRMNQRPVPEKFHPETEPTDVSHRFWILAKPRLVNVLVSKLPFPPANSGTAKTERGKSAQAAAMREKVDFIAKGAHEICQ